MTVDLPDDTSTDAAGEPDLQWGVRALWTQLEPLLPGLSVEVVACCASTSTELLERARLAPAPRASDFGGLNEPSGRVGRRGVDTQPCLLIAEHQSAGRGRLGRVWRSTAGASLTFSLAMPLAPAEWSGLSLAVGVALAEALQPDPSDAARLQVKWPNDLWLVDAPADGTDAAAPAGRKLGGVLIETLAGRAQRLVVVGVGLNVIALPQALHADMPQGMACVQEIDPWATAPSTLARIALPLLEALRTFERHGFAAFAARFAARDLLRGHAVTTTQAGVPAGTACGVDAAGALCIEADGVRHHVTSGEVSVRPAGGRGVAAQRPPLR